VRRADLAALTILAASAAGCAAQAESTRPLPAWFVTRSAELANEGYPDLANVPDRIDANVSQPHWNQVQQELDAAHAELRANPRSQPAPAAAQQGDAAAEFDENAREAIESTRRQH
jgi:hypothetical protein